MLERLIFFPRSAREGFFSEKPVLFENGGFSPDGKRKSVAAMHAAALAKFGAENILEVSGSSPNEIGRRLSAFNLSYTTEDGQRYPVENVFQSSKVFERGGPFRDLLFVSPAQAKRDGRLRDSGRLVGFEWEGKFSPLRNDSRFYDWIYVSALRSHADLAEEITGYSAFTDIEFNHEKSFNCQARAAAIYAGLMRDGDGEKYLADENSFAEIYKAHAKFDLGRLLGAKRRK